MLLASAAPPSRCPGCPPRPCLVTPSLPGPWWNCWGALRILPEWVGLGGRTEPVTVVGLPGEGRGVLSGLSVGPEHPECSTVSCGVPGGRRAFLESRAIADQDPGVLFLASLWSPHPFGPWWGQEGRALALTLAWHAVSDTMATPRKARVDSGGHCGVSTSLPTLGEKLVDTAQGHPAKWCPGPDGQACFGVDVAEP